MWQTDKMFYKKILLPFKIKQTVLALGSQTKNTVCFVKDKTAYLSPLRDDLNNPSDFLNFEKVVRYFLRKRPKIITCDLHPEYQSTKYAQDLHPARFKLEFVQHHHAHIASCMTENNLNNQRVIGVAFDGSGLGSDNTFWGAEFLVCDYKNFTRRAHLKTVPLLGQEMAIREPWRLAVVWLYCLYKDGFFNSGLEFTKKIDKKKWRVIKNMYLTDFNSPLASSMGRLFDAAASLIFAEHRTGFEGELAVKLEKIAQDYRLKVSAYPFKINKEKNMYIIDPLPMFQGIIQDLKTKQEKERIAYSFHLTVAQMIQKICLILRRETGIKRIILSGGVFQNKLLLRLAIDLLYRQDFVVTSHRVLSSNDSSISLGQAVIANFRS